MLALSLLRAPAACAQPLLYRSHVTDRTKAKHTLILQLLFNNFGPR